MDELIFPNPAPMSLFRVDFPPNSQPEFFSPASERLGLSSGTQQLLLYYNCLWLSLRSSTRVYWQFLEGRQPCVFIFVSSPPSLCQTHGWYSVGIWGMDGWMDDGCPYYAPGWTLMHHFGISGCSAEQLQSGPHFIIGVTAPWASL